LGDAGCYRRGQERGVAGVAITVAPVEGEQYVEQQGVEENSDNQGRDDGFEEARCSLRHSLLSEQEEALSFDEGFDSARFWAPSYCSAGRLRC